MTLGGQAYAGQIHASWKLQRGHSSACAAILKHEETRKLQKKSNGNVKCNVCDEFAVFVLV